MAPMPLGGNSDRANILTAADKALFRRAAARGRRLKRGRPKIGNGSKLVPITLECGLLKKVDSFAK